MADEPEIGGLSLEGLKERLDHEGDLSDDLLSALLQAALDMARLPPPHGTGRRLGIGPAGETVSVQVSRGAAWIPDAAEITTVTLNATAVSADGYRRWFAHGATYLLTGLQDGTLIVTGRFGLDPIPAPLQEAIYALAARMFMEQRAQWADQVVLPDGGSVQQYYRQLPPRVRAAFEAYAIHRPDRLA